MAFCSSFSPQDQEPGAEQLATQPGPLLLEFGAPWCQYCQAAQPLLASAMQQYQDLPHLKIEDGKGRRLGRSFRVKLWPTLVLLQDGQEVARLVRPDSLLAIQQLLASLPATPRTS
ncbi:thioredoxin family protein [Aquitalea sp. USM4]|uniref:thioredoxin family protein n=1 Tax=Aquitalea sp. USM4 TaxID=1590041 RepID=UPI00103ABE29|nr:thioredoxin family protein [Aquitalea sp. USM4]QBJ79498.1 thiol reductase thioredoxin [Aquitalea sp. USM4]